MFNFNKVAGSENELIHTNFQGFCSKLKGALYKV